MPSMEGTPLLSIVVEDEDRSALAVDLDAILREGARRMLVTALRAEVDEYIAAHGGERDAGGRGLVVRNGVARSRKVTTAAGQLEVQAPKDREALLVHFDFPAEHWIHLRSTNAIESTFATVRLRTHKTKGAGSRAAGLAMAYKLLDAAQARWRCVNAPHLVALVRAGATFVDGVTVEREDQRSAA